MCYICLLIAMYRYQFDRIGRLVVNALHVSFLFARSWTNEHWQCWITLLSRHTPDHTYSILHPEKNRISLWRIDSYQRAPWKAITMIERDLMGVLLRVPHPLLAIRQRHKDDGPQPQNPFLLQEKMNTLQTKSLWIRSKEMESASIWDSTYIYVCLGMWLVDERYVFDASQQEIRSVRKLLSAYRCPSTQFTVHTHRQMAHTNCGLMAATHYTHKTMEWMKLHALMVHAADSTRDDGAKMVKTRTLPNQLYGAVCCVCLNRNARGMDGDSAIKVFFM